MIRWMEKLLTGSGRELQRDQLAAYERARREQGDMARFHVGPPGVGFDFDAVLSPEGAREVLATHAQHFEKEAPPFRELRRLLGEGLITSNGERWRHDRRMLAPIFARRRTGVYVPTIAAAADELVRSWADVVASGEEIDLHESSMRYGLEVLGRTVFGDDVEPALDTLQRAMPVLNWEAARRGLAPVRLPLWWPSAGNRRLAKALAEIHALMDSIIARRREAPIEGADDILSLLLAARDEETGAQFDDRAVRDQALTFLVAGHETTGGVLACTLHLLGRQPEVQARVRDEVRSVVGDRPLRHDDLDQLTYTTAVVDEGLRLFPTAHTLPRQATSEVEVLGRKLPKGRIVAVHIWGIHRHPDVWPDPDRFDPDRFTAEAVESRHRYAHMPFGGGPRSCIGAPLARTELVVAVAAVLRAYRLETTADGLTVSAGLTVRPVGTVPCRATPTTAARSTGDRP